MTQGNLIGNKKSKSTWYLYQYQFLLINKYSHNFRYKKRVKNRCFTEFLAMVSKSKVAQNRRNSVYRLITHIPDKSTEL